MANVIHVIGIVILIFATCSIENINVDNVLLPESLRNNISNGTQKYWAYYTCKITEMVTRNSLFLGSKVQKELNVINVMQRLYSKIKFFKQIAMYIDAASIGTTMVTRPLGKLRKQSPVTQGFANMQENPREWKEFTSGVYFNNRFTWSFNVARVFGVKCNFEKIYFSSYTATKCNWGQLNLKSYSVKEKKTCVYCGQYSDMINYSNLPKMDVIILVKGITFYDVSLSFMVVDSGLGHNYYVPNYYQTDTPVLGILFPTSNMKIHRFYVNSIKLYKLMIRFVYYLENDIVIHDGPGFKNNILEPLAKNKTEPSQMLYFTSSFQCMIHIFKKHQTSFSNTLRYTSMKQSNITKMYLNFNETKVITLPNSIMNHAIGIFEISVPSGFYVNVSILNFKYDGFRISTCRFAGLTTYDNINNSYKEISTACKQHYNIYKSRKMYSETSKMVLVFYQYKEYSTIEVEILLSVTRCNPLSFDILPYRQRY